MQAYAHRITILRLQQLVEIGLGVLGDLDHPPSLPAYAFTLTNGVANDRLQVLYTGTTHDIRRSRMNPTDDDLRQRHCQQRRDEQPRLSASQLAAFSAQQPQWSVTMGKAS